MARPSALRIETRNLQRRQRLIRATISFGLTLPALTVVGLSGCRSDGTSRTEITSIGPMRWFARADTAADAELSETPPVPPPIGRAFVPAPAPAPERAEGSFYGVRRMGAEVAPDEKPTWSERVKDFFNPSKPDEPVLKPVPSSYEDSLSQGRGVESEEIQLTAGPFDEVLENDPPVLIGGHIEPIATGEGFAKDSLPKIVPGRFHPLPVEPAPWPYSQTALRNNTGGEHSAVLTRPETRAVSAAATELAGGPGLPEWSERGLR